MVAISGLTETGCLNLDALLSFGNARCIPKLTNHLVGNFAVSEGALGINDADWRDSACARGCGATQWRCAGHWSVACSTIFEAVFPVVFVRVPPEGRGAGGG
jgi:hypothetical protein